MAVHKTLNIDPIQKILIDNISIDESEIFSESEINSTNRNFNKVKDINSFSVLHINIRSMQNFFNNFKNFYSQLKFLFDVICIIETWESSLFLFIGSKRMRGRGIKAKVVFNKIIYQDNLNLNSNFNSNVNRSPESVGSLILFLLCYVTKENRNNYGSKYIRF